MIVSTGLRCVDLRDCDGSVDDFWYLKNPMKRPVAAPFTRTDVTGSSASAILLPQR
jgi:hypothetical protein